MNEPTKRSPWGIPVFWLVIGLPLLSIVAGVGLVVIAVRSGGADTVSDPVRRVSQIQTADLGPDAAARKLGLSAVLRVEDGIVEVLPATGSFAHDAPLQLVLEHPTRQADDVRLELAPQGPGWRAAQAIDRRDYPVLQGIFLLLTMSVILFNLIADLLYFKLDPRVTS